MNLLKFHQLTSTITPLSTSRHGKKNISFLFTHFLQSWFLLEVSTTYLTRDHWLQELDVILVTLTK